MVFYLLFTIISFHLDSDFLNSGTELLSNVLPIYVDYKNFSEVCEKLTSMSFERQVGFGPQCPIQYPLCYTDSLPTDGY